MAKAWGAKGAKMFQYPLGGSWGCNVIPTPCPRQYKTFQYPLGGSWGCNKSANQSSPRSPIVSVSSGWIVGVQHQSPGTKNPRGNRFSILWVDRGGATPDTDTIWEDEQSFSILWVDRGGATRNGVQTSRRLPSVSVSSGWIVGVQRLSGYRLQRLYYVSVSSGWIVGVQQTSGLPAPPNSGVSVSSGWIVGVQLRGSPFHHHICKCFSILWVDRGGATPRSSIPAIILSRFSILWVDRGGATTFCFHSVSFLKRFSILWVDRGGATAGSALGSFIVPKVSVSSGWIVGVQQSVAWYEREDPLVSVSSGWIVGVQPTTCGRTVNICAVSVSSGWIVGVQRSPGKSPAPRARVSVSSGWIVGVQREHWDAGHGAVPVSVSSGWIVGVQRPAGRPRRQHLHVSVSSGWIVGVQLDVHGRERAPGAGFSILWVDRGGATWIITPSAFSPKRFQYPLGGSWGCNHLTARGADLLRSVSVSSGWIVGVQQIRHREAPPAIARFSILWVDRGGATDGGERIYLYWNRFSILWVDRGGATVCCAWYRS